MPPAILKGVTTMSKALFLPAGNICAMQILKDFRPDLDFYYNAIGCDTADIVSAYAFSDIDGLENVQLEIALCACE